jgi:hypothetical protein
MVVATALVGHQPANIGSLAAGLGLDGHDPMLLRRPVTNSGP